ncbi:hypothetical protein VP1G_11078 [Cytospora mali]|uniref:Uncharacterized protein n=1 Tax=Cytospora mali TaxID=578113 RepID=A0A194V5V9_CYTMA|nr:hypothetical protein VP1G_11078 [Valsa mali var. pyri (nom. inval.)]
MSSGGGSDNPPPSPPHSPPTPPPTPPPQQRRQSTVYSKDHYKSSGSDQNMILQDVATKELAGCRLGIGFW